MIFFLDNCISYRAAKMLDAFDSDNSVVALRERFEQATPDVEWMRKVAEWPDIPFVVSGDGRILRNAVEKKVLAETGLTFFVLAPQWAKASWDDTAWRLVRAWPTIAQAARHNTRQTVYEIPFNKQKLSRSGLS